MPITITITDPTPAQIAALFGVAPAKSMTEAFAEAMTEKPKATRAKPTPKVAEPDTTAMSAEDAELAADMARDLAEAAPEPEGAKQIVDAGTGQPATPASASREMTMDEVRASATRLAQANAPGLKAILNGFGAAKLSEVKPDDLPDFAGQVLAALG